MFDLFSAAVLTAILGLACLDYRAARAFRARCRDVSLGDVKHLFDRVNEVAYSVAEVRAQLARHEEAIDSAAAGFRALGSVGVNAGDLVRSDLDPPAAAHGGPTAADGE